MYMQVDPSVFEKEEEKALWSAFLEVADKIHPGTQIFFEAKSFISAVYSVGLLFSPPLGLLCCEAFVLTIVRVLICTLPTL